MKRILILIFATTAFFACKKKEPEEDPSNSSKNSYTVDYKDQDLQGIIGGTAWEYVTGETHVSYFDENEFWVNIVDSIGNDTCNLPFSKRPKILFIHQEDTLNPEMKVGKYDLSFEWDENAVNRTITLVYYDEENTPQNMIATEGQYELLSVDTINNTVKGRMDAFFDNSNFVNGNFTIKYCR